MNKIDLNGYVAISLEDYAEYQELKHPKIDYSKLKTGSVVRLKYTDSFCSAGDVNFEKPFTVLLKDCNYCIVGTGRPSSSNIGQRWYTFIQDDQFCLFSSDLTIDYITEVISY